MTINMLVTRVSKIFIESSKNEIKITAHRNCIISSNYHAMLITKTIIGLCRKHKSQLSVYELQTETYFSPKVGDEVLGEILEVEKELACFFPEIGIAGVSSNTFVSSGIFY